MSIPSTKPVPAIVLQAQMQWDQVINELTKLAIQDDQNALNMGDLFVKIVEQWGRDKLRPAALSAGVEWSKARQRHWISSSIPPSDPIRKMMLPFAHLRHLAGVKDAEQRLYWAKLSLENDWTAVKLKEELDQAEDKQAQEQGALCCRCTNPIRPSDVMVTLRVTGQKTVRACGPQHAADYLEELALQIPARIEAEPNGDGTELDTSQDPLDDEE